MSDDECVVLLITNPLSPDAQAREGGERGKARISLKGNYWESHWPQLLDRPLLMFAPFTLRSVPHLQRQIQCALLRTIPSKAITSQEPYRFPNSKSAVLRIDVVSAFRQPQLTDSPLTSRFPRTARSVPQSHRQSHRENPLAELSILRRTFQRPNCKPVKSLALVIEQATFPYTS